MLSYHNEKIPEWLAYVQDIIFKELPNDERNQFVIDLLEAILVDIDLELLRYKFCAFLLRENIERIKNLTELSKDLRTVILESLQLALQLHENAINTGVWDENSAENVRRSAEHAGNTTVGIGKTGEIPETLWRVTYCVIWSAIASTANIKEDEYTTQKVLGWTAEMTNGDKAAKKTIAYQRYAEELLRLLKEV
jgi:hypothetical protein